jgi:hypothetical protein
MGTAACFRWWRPRTAATTGYLLAPSGCGAISAGLVWSAESPHVDSAFEGHSGGFENLFELFVERFVAMMLSWFSM